jgi:hypothetical protein
VDLEVSAVPPLFKQTYRHLLRPQPLLAMDAVVVVVVVVVPQLSVS